VPQKSTKCAGKRRLGLSSALDQGLSACAGEACPRISLIFAARDEEEKLPAALATLAAIDYPNLEIICCRRSLAGRHRPNFWDDFG